MFEFGNQDFSRIFNRASKCIAAVLIIAYGEISQAQHAAQSRIRVRGTPRVIHYTRNDFDSDPQIWAMCQDREGILYFGSNKGALIFNGETWQTVRLPNNSSVRSLAVNSQGVVLAGGFNEFGAVRKDEYGRYYYDSWTHLLRTEDRNIENVWAIHEVQGHMVFRSYKMLIAISGNKAVTLPTSGMYEYSAVLNNNLFVTDGAGVKSVDLDKLEFDHVIADDDLRQENFLSIVPGYGEEQVFVITKEGSFFELDRNGGKPKFLFRVLPVNANNLLTCTLKASGGHYYVGTLSSKVILVTASATGQVDTEIFHDLQDNTVHNLFETREGNIWALLNNGIDCIDINSPITLLLDNASIFDVLFYETEVFVATNQGVFTAPLNPDGQLPKANFSKVNGLEGQAWSLQTFEGKILCSHDRGVFVREAGAWKRLNGPKGIWKVAGIDERPGHFLVCTYDGLFPMHHDPLRGFQIGERVAGFNESSRDLIQGEEPGLFWICHGYKGVFRVRVDQQLARIVSFEHFKDGNGLPSPFNINVRRWKNEIVFTTNQGVFRYNEKENKFEIFAPLTTLFGTRSNVRQLQEFGDKTWFVQNDEVGYFNAHDVQPQLVKGLFLQLKGSMNESMECIEPVSENNVLVGTRDGLYAFDLQYTASRSNAQTLITSVHYKQDSLEEQCVVTAARRQIFPHTTRGVRFDFAVPDFDDKINTQYSFRVDGISSEWSPWQDEPFAEYSLLPPGVYTFRVRARSMFGETAAEASYPFEIVPQWYKTPFASSVYALLALGVMIIGARIIQRRIESVRLKTRNEEEEKRRLLQLELDRMKLKREKEEIQRDKVQLEEDVIFKSKELANYTMLLVRKREFLSEIFEQLNSLREAIKNDQARQTLRDIQKKITGNLQSEEHLRVFEANFERVHHHFFAQLRSNFPDLSPKELQLCAFVKMNLTNKEIASILNLSVRGIETARYRLRKRLGISQEEDMAEFLEKLYCSAELPADVKISS